MNYIEANDGSLALNYPLTYLDPSSSATHFSHAGVGGFVEFPTIEYRNSIPTTSTMHTGGLSSGRRKVGMIVYISENKKFYQLIPRNPDGTIITPTEWNSTSLAKRVTLLNPNAVDIEDPDTFEFYSGSGNPDEVWTEIFVKGWEEKTNEFAPAIIPPFSPKRPVYFVADNSTSIPNTEPHFDALSKDFDLSDGSVFGIQVGTNAKRIVIAYPEIYGDLTRVIDSSTGFNIIGSFNKTTFNKLPPLSTDFTPPNTNYDSLTSIQYNVYTSILAVSYSSPTVYTVTI